MITSYEKIKRNHGSRVEKHFRETDKKVATSLLIFVTLAVTAFAYSFLIGKKIDLFIISLLSIALVFYIKAIFHAFDY